MRSRAAFTLVELLVVVAIIGVLVALLLPAVQASRAAASRVDCQNRLKQVGLALLLYHDDQTEFPPGNLVVEEGICRGWGIAGRDYPSQDGANWAIHLLPYLEQEVLHDQYDYNTFNESEINGPVVAARVDAYLCPVDTEAAQLQVPSRGPAADIGLNIPYMPGSYRGMSGSSEGAYYLDSSSAGVYKHERRGVLHAVGFGKFRKETIAKITDGTSHTLAIGESVTRTDPTVRTLWAYSYSFYSLSAATPQSRILVGDYKECVATGGYGGSWPCQRGWGSFHPGVVNFVQCDGSIRAIEHDIDPEVFVALGTIAGGDIVRD